MYKMIFSSVTNKYLPKSSLSETFMSVCFHEQAMREQSLF